jgi:hypothetical protein
VSKIQIDTVNYFGNIEGENYNAKVLYRKNGKLRLANIYIDYFWKRIYIPKKQHPECKVLKGLDLALFDHIFKK